MPLKTKIIAFLMISVIAFTSSTAIYAYNTVNQLVSDENFDETEVSANDKLDTDVINIALFGIDGRSDVDGDRSDTIIICSVNFVDGTIKVTSVMRDLMAQIPATSSKSVSYEKINSAYEYGGPSLAVQTLNENFDLNITDYVDVNFDCLVGVVDALGGVDINIADESILYWTNQYIMDVNDKVGRHDPFLETIGPQTLTGVQALAYCRNRYSDSDYGRTQRQREVLGQIAQKAFTMDSGTALNLLNKVFPYIQTSISKTDMIKYTNAFLGLENKQFLEFRVPTDQNSTTDMIDELSYVIPTTLADNVTALHQFLYGDTPYIPSERVVTISNTIAEISGYGSSGSYVPETTETTIDDSIDTYNEGSSSPEYYPETESVPETTEPVYEEPTDTPIDDQTLEDEIVP